MAKILLVKVFWLFDFGHLFLSIFENPKYFYQKQKICDHKNSYGLVTEKITQNLLP